MVTETIEPVVQIKAVFTVLLYVPIFVPSGFSTLFNPYHTNNELQSITRL